ncbi:hypothetical protein LEP1GSC116_3031, partial [Leptospira interrogans serovar Icterohaemorrhagiae str. Verdun HP]
LKNYRVKFFEVLDKARSFSSEQILNGEAPNIRSLFQSILYSKKGLVIFQTQTPANFRLPVFLFGSNSNEGFVLSFCFFKQMYGFPDFAFCL